MFFPKHATNNLINQSELKSPYQMRIIDQMNNPRGKFSWRQDRIWGSEQFQ
jgi:hypothetical protein